MESGGSKDTRFMCGMSWTAGTSGRCGRARAPTSWCPASRLPLEVDARDARAPKSVDGHGQRGRWCTTPPPPPPL